MNTAEETRDIYLKQHTLVSEDDVAMKRFINMFSDEYFGFEPGYLQGKKVLDAGCGNTSKLMIALNHLGASDISGVDLGEEFIEPAKKSFNKYKIDDSELQLMSGNILNLPYPDNYFDCTFCHGVLVVLSSEDEVKQAIRELSRVTKVGGDLYVMVACHGGVLEDAIFPAIRKYYRNNSDFKKWVDDVSSESLQALTRTVAGAHSKELGSNLSFGNVEELLDTDFSVTIQNIVQPPSWLSISYEDLYTTMEEEGFSDINRCKRFIKRKNIRKFFSPLHYSHNSQLSQILYGDGSVEIIGKKFK